MLVFCFVAALLGCSDPNEALFELNRQSLDTLNKVYSDSERVEDLAPHLSSWGVMVSDWRKHLDQWETFASEVYLYFNYELAMLRLMNLYLHFGEEEEAFEVLLQVVRFRDNTEGFGMEGLSIPQKALIMIHEWRYIERGLGLPEWESEDSVAKLLGFVRGSVE
ncbi:MAG: hypothetical protein JJU20_14110 [Opitutales bacterium]|nr:hypothetical protein [Opitutales bacterium]